jgi:hypothetical protein
MICLQMIRRGSPIKDGAFRDLTDIGLDYTVETSIHVLPGSRNKPLLPCESVYETGVWTSRSSC